MRSRLTTVITVTISLAVFAQTLAAEEFYFRMSITSREELESLTRLVSIDNVIDTVVFAYANDAQLRALDDSGYTFDLLPHPGRLIKPKMAASALGVLEWDSYPTHEAYMALMQQFALDYPEICRVSTIGYSIDGREILAAKISDSVDLEEDEPEVFLTSTIHGDETVGYVLMLRLIDCLLTGYGTDPQATRLVDSMEIWINPLSNPDGTYGSDNSTVYGATRFNSAGVDLNRNFPNAEDGPHPDGYDWQPETIAMMDFAEAHSFVLSANFHGGTEVVNYPWDTWERLHADDTWYRLISRAYADSAQANSPSGYMDDRDNGITNGWAWYPVSGSRQDYMNYEQGCREVTIELSSTKLLSPGLLPYYWDYNRVSFLNYPTDALCGIRGVVTDASTGMPLAATVSVLDHDVEGTQVFTDPDVGDYHRMIAPGAYDVVFTASGFVDDTARSVVVEPNAAVRLDIGLWPVPTEPMVLFAGHSAIRVRSGDTVNMHVDLSNAGAGDATGVSARLGSGDPRVAILQDTSSYPDMPPSDSAVASNTAFLFVVSPECPPLHEITFELEVNGNGGLTDTFPFGVVAGLEVEDFESADFLSYGWHMSEAAPWRITSDDKRSGQWSAQNGMVSDGQFSEMAVELDHLIAGDISFWLKTSTQPDADVLEFAIDGGVRGTWSGDTDWRKVAFASGPGSHTFTWRYVKDGAVSFGNDAVLVDDITFPSVSIDFDTDGVVDVFDICPEAYDPGQEDSDGDGPGDACDNCPLTYNPDQADSLGNGIGDACRSCCTGEYSGNTDCDQDDARNLADITRLIDYIYISKADLCCEAEGNVDGDEGGRVNLADITALINHIYVTKAAVAPCR